MTSVVGTHRDGDIAVGIPATVVEAAEDALKRGFGVMEKN